VQPCSPALPPGPSVPQLAGWSLPSDAPVRAATEAKRNERSTAMMYKGGAANLPGELENWGQGRTEVSVHFYAGKCTLTPIFVVDLAQALRELSGRCHRSYQVTHHVSCGT
jgi:hypothetical protein